MPKTDSKLRHNAEFWHQLNRLIISVILLAIVGVAVLTFYPEWTRRDELLAQREKGLTQLASEQLLQKQRSREINLLQTDPEYVEMIARDKLDVMKEGETIFRLDPTKAPPIETPISKKAPPNPQ